ncbi:MAG: 3-methyl-2-oxobutanoate dehydrogenase (2-methylpropanoyl-transferring) subunit alpha [Rhizobiales bacterium]|nr:3-methyl-2-oxobutanoate dehydrogenase (2-methylpropanoyl-transferring) subunit alpha [Hyphomicrobiales bacterium]NRB13214.1 3-methyl-2-oxobutanoate dehydrogenase (2-methylpropanoyl-transferring) subunit alpha [Hyphomicrobiales bacterium]
MAKKQNQSNIVNSLNKLHVPQPTARPDEFNDFSNLNIPNVEQAECPAIDTNPHEMRGLAYGLIRVLDDDGNAAGNWNSTIEPHVLVKGLKDMLVTRMFDERMQMMHRVGKISFYMKSTGEEAISVAHAAAINFADMVFPSYRNQGILIARGYSLVDMMCQCLSNARDNCKGRQLPIMYSWKKGNFFSISGNLATQFSQAVGWAMAEAQQGGGRVASAFVGEGSTAELDFHSALTFATAFSPPVILNITNNQWAISSNQVVAGGEKTTFAARGIGFGLPSLRVDGNDFLAVYAATKWAAARARAGLGATVIEYFTYRVAPHSSSDDPSAYRPKNEPDFWPLGDPIDRLKTHLINLNQWSETQHETLIEDIKTEMKQNYKQAESYGTLKSGDRPDVTTMFEDVYEDMPLNLLRQRQEMGL